MPREPIAAAAVVGGAASVQVGAAIGATIFPLVGPGGVVALRQAFAAIALLAVSRPRMRDLTWRSVRPALLLGLVLVTMNLGVYGAIDRIGLGLAVTLEFLGPLALAPWQLVGLGLISLGNVIAVSRPTRSAPASEPPSSPGPSPRPIADT
jgi:inner membrane transporter RhtA